MNNFAILRNRRNVFIGFLINGYTVKTWQELQDIAESIISKNDPSWHEIWVNADDFSTEGQHLHEVAIETLQHEIESLKRINDKQGEELENMGFQLIQSKKTQDDLISHFERFKIDALDRFRAIKILVSTSIRDCNIGLNHRVRDERLKHLSDVIDAQISDCGCFTLRTYDDDF